MIPSYSWKPISRWTNYSSKVINQKIIEKGMGYRGYKSIVLSNFIAAIVKEQRVNGSYYVSYISYFRSTLRDFERNYKVRFLSSGIHIKQRSNKVVLQSFAFLSLSSQKKLNLSPAAKIKPWFVTGFTDAEGCFFVNVVKDNKYKTGWRIQLAFSITLHKKDKALLEDIKIYFGEIGSFNTKHGPDTIKYLVYSIEDLAVVIHHFDKYPMITEKWADYLLFKMIFNLIDKKEHLTMKGLLYIISIKASMNKGLSSKLKKAFPNIIPIARPGVLDKKIKDPLWLAGFASGEACFYIGIFQSSSTKVKAQVQLNFQIAQNSRDTELLKNLIEFLDCGIYRERKKVLVGYYYVVKFSDLKNKIIPFFQKYCIKGVKSKDFADFCEVVELMENKAHLTPKGLDQIGKIKERMNIGRILS